MLRQRERAQLPSSVLHAAIICLSQWGSGAGLYDLVLLERFKSACLPAISPCCAFYAGWAVWTFLSSTTDAPKAAVVGVHGACFFWSFYACLCRPLPNICAAAPTLKTAVAGVALVSPPLGI